MPSPFRYRVFRLVLEPVSAKVRFRRMARCKEVMAVRTGLRVLDLGGQPAIWDGIEDPLDITCVNLPGVALTDHPTHHRIDYVEGDACSLPHYGPGDFDLIFSNSVIEHVGDGARRAAFADEVRRLETPYWIQTPSRWFPLEAHCGMPFWWFYPRPLRQFFCDRWRRELPEWTDMVEGTTVLSASELRRLFPNGQLAHEWLVFPKSMVVHQGPTRDLADQAPAGAGRHV